MGPFSPVEMAHWEKSCETWQRDVRTFSLDVLRGPSNWYMVVSLFCPKSSQYAFCCLSPSDWEKGKNWKRLPFSGVLHKTTFSSALSALNNRFLEWGFQYRTFIILSPSNRCALGECVPKYFEVVSFDRGLFTYYVSQNGGFIDPSPLLCQQWSAFGWPQPPLPRQKWPSFGCPPLRQHLPDALFVLFLSLFFDVICD